MGDRETTTPKPNLDIRNSSQGMQEVCASSRPAMKIQLPAKYDAIPRRPSRSIQRPIFAIDPLAFKRDKKSSAISLVVHVLIIGLVLSLALKAHRIIALQPATIVTPVDFNTPIPPMILPVARLEGGGGGGGAHEIVEATKGELPTIVKLQTMATQVIRIDQPKLAMEPSAQVKMPDSESLSALGVAHSQQVSLASQGRGSGSGLGQGLGGGIGMGHGSGAGPGSGGGYGGGLMSVGGGVAAPELIHSVEPEFTEDARRANFQGNVSIRLIVDSQGNPQDVQLVQHLGMGLDEKAIEAVRQYKFKPAMYQGHAVSVQIVIEMGFHLH